MGVQRYGFSIDYKNPASHFNPNDALLVFILDWQSDYNVGIVAFAPTLERWYEHHKRDLPWRHTRDPYRIWLSEIILQQTRVAQGLPYYQRFVDAYPTVADMARADERDVLRLWQGLGYYSRARNLHQTAKQVATTLGGRFPASYRELLILKGIGTYTAAAIASFAFDERVPVVDGNVYRVLARVFGVTEDITTPSAKKTFTQLAVALMAHADDPATYNQSIMEFGAIQCTLVSPDCLLCPVQSQCVAFQTGRQHKLPVKAKKAAVRERYFVYLVFQQRDSTNTLKLALRERTAKDIWQNLYDFYLIETDEPKPALRDVTLPEAVQAMVASGRTDESLVAGQQLLSHQRIKASFYRIDLPTESPAVLPPGLAWYSADEISRLPKPVLITTYFENTFG